MIASAVVAWIEAPAFVNGMSATASHRGQLLQTGNVQTQMCIRDRDEIEISQDLNEDFEATDLFIRLNSKPYPIKMCIRDR